jgi:hypothetical protein
MATSGAKASRAVIRRSIRPFSIAGLIEACSLDECRPRHFVTVRRARSDFVGKLARGRSLTTEGAAVMPVTAGAISSGKQSAAQVGCIDDVPRLLRAHVAGVMEKRFSMAPGRPMAVS